MNNMDKLLDTEEFELVGEEKDLDRLLDDEEEKAFHGTIKLEHAILIDDEETTEIEYDFRDIRPIQYINLVKRIGKKKNIPIPELDQDVQIGMFSLASNIPVSELKRIEDTRDFIKITTAARDFLLPN